MSELNTEKFVFTRDNFIDNLEKIGVWSIYGLASEALQYYFPEEYDEDGHCDSLKEIELADKLGCQYWQDVVIKYHNEVGYKFPFDPEYVNEF
jgi:hypothetical protein